MEEGSFVRKWRPTLATRLTRISHCIADCSPSSFPAPDKIVSTATAIALPGWRHSGVLPVLLAQQLAQHNRFRPTDIPSHTKPKSIDPPGM